jgi:hypothetical protein
MSSIVVSSKGCYGDLTNEYGCGAKVCHGIGRGHARDLKLDELGQPIVVGLPALPTTRVNSIFP